MGFEPKDKAEKYLPEEGDTLKAIAEKKDISLQDLARFNWGTDDEQEVNRFLRDELGARHRSADNNYCLSADDDPNSDLLIPRHFRRDGLKFNKIYNITLAKTIDPPNQLNACYSAHGSLFPYAQSFIYPEIKATLQRLNKNQGKLVVFGHSDDMGDRQKNKDISLQRAKTVYGLLTHNTKDWEAATHAEQWGLQNFQVMLSELDEKYNPGNVYGGQTEQNLQAIKNFQTDFSCEVSGALDDKTKLKIIAEYFKVLHPEALSADRFAPMSVMGCADINPVAEVKGKQEKNRRVTIYSFNPNRIPRFPCKEQDLQPCDRQIFPGEKRFADGFACSFYDSLGEDCSCEGQSLRANLHTCEWDKLTVSCAHGRTIDIAAVKPTINGDYVLQVISHGPELEKIKAQYHSQCGKDGGHDCGKLTITNAGVETLFTQDQNFKLEAPNLNKSEIRFIDFLTKYLVPVPTNFKPDKYVIEAENCEGKLKRNIVVEVFPLLKWNGEIAFGYIEPTSYSKNINKQRDFKNLKDQGRWTLAGNIDLQLGSYKYKYGLKAGEPEANYFTTLKENLYQMFAFFNDIKGNLKAGSKNLVNFTVKGPAVTLKGDLKLAESKSSYAVGVEGSVSLNFKPLIEADIKVDILDWIIWVAAPGYGEFVKKIKEAAAQGLVTSEFEGKVVLGIYLSVSGGVSGKLGWTKAVDDDWIATSGDKTMSMSGDLGLKLEGKAEAKGRIFFVTFGLGVGISLEGADGKADKVGIVGEVKAGVINGSPGLKGNLTFTGAAIYYTYYAEVGVSQLEDKGIDESKKNKRGKVKEKIVFKEKLESKIEKKIELIEIFKKYSWPNAIDSGKVKLSEAKI